MSSLLLPPIMIIDASEPVDSSYSISTNIHGRKLWTLFPPSCTTALEPLLAHALRTDTHLDIREWDSTTRDDFIQLGMKEQIQQEGETIFIPSGWFHQVDNLTNPTISINHNWCNSHNLLRMYCAMEEETVQVRKSIEDVRVLLRERGGEGWESKWTECVEELLERSAGWK